MPYNLNMLGEAIALGSGLLLAIIPVLIKKWLDRRREERDRFRETRDDLVVILDQLREDYNRVKEARKDSEEKLQEMSQKVEELKAETEIRLEAMRKEIVLYRDKYYGTLDQLVKTQIELQEFLRQRGITDKDGLDNPEEE